MCRVDRTSECIDCKKSFEEVGYHCKNMCRTCYNIQWARTNRSSKKREALDHCIKCLSKWGSTSIKGKPVAQASRGMCKICYNQYYAKVASTICRRCNKDMGKKSKSVCSLCKVELEAMKSPSKRKLPKTDSIQIDKHTKETMRRLFNRYKFGTNTLVDPFVTLNLYLEVFSDENIKGQTASKTEFNLDQFDQENQVIAMLKLLKNAYDKCL